MNQYLLILTWVFVLVAGWMIVAIIVGVHAILHQRYNNYQIRLERFSNLSERVSAEFSKGDQR